MIRSFVTAPVPGVVTPLETLHGKHLAAVTMQLQPGCAKTLGRWAPLVLVVLGAIVASFAVFFTWRVAPFPLWVWLPVQVAGFSFVVSGVVLWLRRPANPTGRLMSAMGLTWYIGELQLTNQAVLFAVGFCFFHVCVTVMGHLVLSLPDGRLHGRSERSVVGFAYIVGPLTQVARFVAEDPLQPQGWGNPQAAVSIWATVGSVAMLALTVATGALVVRRWLWVGRPSRRAYTVVWVTILAMGAVVVATTVAVLLAVPLSIQQCLLLACAVVLLLIPIALAIGLLRFRMARVGVADLVVRLEHTSAPQHVRAAIADALGDPDLEVLFPLARDGRFVRSDGRAVSQRAIGMRATTPVVRRGELLALLVHDSALLNQRPLVDAVSAASGLALDNARLVATQQAQLAEVHASRARIVVAADTERRRIQRDLHDGVQHKLLAVSMLLERVGHTPHYSERSEHAAAHATDLATASTHLRDAICELRALAEGIHSPALAEQGLAVAVEVLAERAPLPLLTDIPTRRWPEHVERAAYFVITEALANVYKHAGASTVRIVIDGDARRLVVEITDDGVGGADPARGTGLRGLHDRVGALNGLLYIESAPEMGTRVVAELPCAS